MKEKRFLYLFIFIVASLITGGCTSSKDVIYFQDIDQAEIVKIPTNYEATIKKDDELLIIITSPDKAVVDPYNFAIGDLSEGTTNLAKPETPILTCVVDADGNINFPIFGKIHVEGMTRLQLIELLESRIGNDVRNPIVYVNFKNFKFTVLGEVRNPGTFTFNTERLTVLQALGYAGDLTVMAERKNIILIREIDGVQNYIKLDLRNSDLLSSPYFYLQQNDVLYVPPSPSRLMSANSSTVWNAVSAILSTVSISVAVISLILNNNGQ